jgi:hypothetical protein
MDFVWSGFHSDSSSRGFLNDIAHDNNDNVKLEVKIPCALLVANKLSAVCLAFDCLMSS